MATNYTANYGLCQWEPEDNFLRAEFNQDNTKIDEALAELESSKADNTSVDSRFATVNSSITNLKNTDAKKANITDMDSRFAGVDDRFEEVNADIAALAGRVEVIVGTYTGTGTASQTINLGFTPKAVLVECSSGSRLSSGVRYGGMAMEGLPCVGHSTVVEVVTGGFRVYQGSSVNVNDRNMSYYYLAFK